MLEMQALRGWGWVAVCLAGLGLVILVGPPGAATGQEKAKKVDKKTAAAKKKAANVPALDSRAADLNETFIKEATTLADEYFEAGSLDKSKALLQAVLKINPESKQVQEKLKDIDDAILSFDESEVEVNVAKGWEWSGFSVLEDQPFRAKAEGTYRFAVNTTVGPAGFSQADLTKDMVPGAPTGALVGVIVKEDGKQGRPFVIGNGGDFRFKETGRLFLKVNSPPENKNVGKVVVTFSGVLIKGSK
jgi:hypothetical protein